MKKSRWYLPRILSIIYVFISIPFACKETNIYLRIIDLLPPMTALVLAMIVWEWKKTGAILYIILSTVYLFTSEAGFTISRVFIVGFAWILGILFITEPKDTSYEG